MVFLAAFLGWFFDGFELGLFPMVARPALQSLLRGAQDAQIGPWMANITASFLIGAALGGMLFGWLGDRVGRVRALSASILTYSLFTGFGYFAQSPQQLGELRFCAALGMGGEWSLGVALVMECWPDRWRPALAGAIGAASNAGTLFTGVAAKAWPVTTQSWRFMFLIGALPALLVFFIRLFVPESQRWQSIAAERPAQPLRELFAPALRGRTLVAIGLASIALIGSWGCVQWIPLWVDQLAGKSDPTAKADVQMVKGVGAICGCLLAPIIGVRLGRRRGYFVLCIASFAIAELFFCGFSHYSRALLLTSFFVTLTTASFYGYFPFYFPELFPTRVRATGQGLSYNFGRLFAAAGALLQGQLVKSLDGSYGKASAVISLVYLFGIVFILFAPETRGQSLKD